MLAAALDPIITIDAYGTIQSASDSVLRVFGWTPGELVGRNVNVLMPDPHHTAHDSYLSNYRRTGQTNILNRTREFEAVRKGGERFPIELSVARVDASGGSLPLFVGMIRDITERKRLERELRLVQDLALSISNARSLSEALIGTLRLICEVTEWDYGEVWLPSPDGKELKGESYWVRQGSGLEGFARTLDGGWFRRGNGLAGRAWSTGKPVWVGDLLSTTEEEFCRPDAAREAGLRAATAVPILADGKPIAVLIFFVRSTRREDIHLLELVRAAVAPLGSLIQRKRIEQELTEYRQNLEEKVNERTRALQESQEKLRLADRLASIGTLAAGLGHDMNNVLLPVRAHLNVLRATHVKKGGKPDGGEGKHIEEIMKGVAYLQQLADGLHFLAMDPDSESDVRGDGEITDMKKWWSQAGLLISKAVPKHVQVTASFPADLPPVDVPAHRLTQAVLNLVVNAGEAIPPPTERKRVQGRVRVWAKEVPDKGLVRLGVTDNGRGMTEEVRRRAFEMFYTTKTRGLGTGLGLPLVRKVVDAARGTVEVESEPGKGTTFFMVLRAASTGGLVRRARVAVMVTDGRAAAMIREILRQSGAEVVADAADAEMVVADPSEVSPEQQAGLVAGRENVQVVLFGRPDEAARQVWGSERTVVIEQRDDFESIRLGIARAFSSLPA